MKKIFSCIFVLAIFFLLTACGKQKEPERVSNEIGGQLNVAYRPESTMHTLEADRISGACVIDHVLYVLSSRMDVQGDGGQYTTGNVAELSQISEDGAIRAMPLSYDFGHVEYFFSTPVSVQAGPDHTLWVLLDVRAGLTDDAGSWLEEADVHLLYQMDAKGSHLNTIELTEFEEELGIGLPNNFALDADGWFYFLYNGEIYVLSGELEYQFSLPTGFHSACTDLLVRFPDGQVGSLVRAAKGPGQDPVYEMRLIDKEARGWGAAYPLPKVSESAYPGSGGYLFFVNSSGHICGWNEERDILEQVVDSSGAYTDLSGHLLKCFSMDEDGTIQIVTCPGQDDTLERVTLTPLDPDGLPEKATLTLACLGASGPLQNYVNKFNQTRQDCQIQLVEYSDPHMPMEGYERMIVDIIAGNVPDILCLDRLPAEKFGAKGLFEDLWPYIESDPELGRDALMSRVLECAEQEGKLYYIFDGFSIVTAAAPAGVAGDRLGWTLEDMRAALEQMPEGCQAYSPAESKYRLLYELLNADMDRYVDWETGTCSFDGGEFQELLGYINSLDISPDQRGSGIEYMEEAVLDGRQMLYYDGSAGLITNFFDVQRCEAVLGGPVCFVGNPKGDGSCGSAFYVGFNSCPLAVTAACKDKEAAWSFLRELLLPQGVRALSDDVSMVSQFPINREDFEELWRRSAELEEEALPGRLFSDAEGNDLLSVRYEAPAQAEYGQIMALYDAIETMYRTDEDLWEIVSAEAGAYFAGELPLEETVSRIQARVQLYIDEQR